MEFRSAQALLLGTISIATLHALIPSHWLAFAMVGRAQRWPLRRTLIVTLTAGAGHILTTLLLGIVVSALGKAALRSIPESLEHAVTASTLILLGAYFAVPALLRKKEHGPHDPLACAHSHLPGAHVNDMEAETAPSSGIAVRTATVTGALILGMTLSPCVDLLPIYVAYAALPWSVIALNSVVMATVTLGIMVGLAWLTQNGLERLNLHWLEHNEGIVVGGILAALGVLLLYI